MARVVWTREALENIQLIRTYIDQFDPSAAQRMARRLIEAGNSLTVAPHRGRPVANDRRELVTVPPYIIRYWVDGETIIIGRVRHSAQAPTD